MAASEIPDGILFRWLSILSATGSLFSVNPKTNDARISGSLASLCGLEKALLNQDLAAIDMAVARII
jgi:amylosucrase